MPPESHHQWYPDILYHEKNLSPDTRRILTAKGHELKLRTAMGSYPIHLCKGWHPGGVFRSEEAGCDDLGVLS